MEQPGEHSYTWSRQKKTAVQARFKIPGVRWRKRCRILFFPRVSVALTAAVRAELEVPVPSTGSKHGKYVPTGKRKQYGRRMA